MLSLCFSTHMGWDPNLPPLRLLCFHYAFLHIWDGIRICHPSVCYAFTMLFYTYGMGSESATPPFAMLSLCFSIHMGWDPNLPPLRLLCFPYAFLYIWDGIRICHPSVCYAFPMLFYTYGMGSESATPPFAMLSLCFS